MSHATAPSAHFLGQQRRILCWAFCLNALMFVAELLVGWWTSSTALMADSADMFADAMVYALSLYALGRSQQLKATAALLNAASHLLFAVLILIEVLRCTLVGTVPSAMAMSALSVAALLVNASCFVMLGRIRNADINLRATWLCSRNDMLGNCSILLAAGLVAALGTAWPDRVLGVTLAALMLHTALTITREALPLLRATTPAPPVLTATLPEIGRAR